VIEYLENWLANIETNHGVNPLIFAAIYCAGIVPFWFALYKISAGIKNKNPGQIKKFSLILGVVIIAPFTYVAFFGHAVPLWFWIVGGCVIGYTVFSITRKIK